jgi:2-polyprenyl-3-methyl-5-hydroxy-6-metoxy-1,4-benzoquinol methylase
MAIKEGLFSLGQRGQSWLNTSIILGSGNKSTRSEMKSIKRGYEPKIKLQSPVEKKGGRDYVVQKIELGLTDGYVNGRSVLDIGCGNKGTLIKGLLKEDKAKEVSGADLKPVIEEAKKQLQPEHSGNLFAVDLDKESTDFPNNGKKQMFDIVVLNSVLDHHVLPESTDRLEANIGQVRKFMKDDGEAIIYPVKQESWENFLGGFNLKHPQEMVLFQFKESGKKTDPFKRVVLWKGDGVNKGRFQC